MTSSIIVPKKKSFSIRHLTLRAHKNINVRETKEA